MTDEEFFTHGDENDNYELDESDADHQIGGRVDPKIVAVLNQIFSPPHTN